MANAQIQTLPTVIPLYKNFYLHYGMTQPPLVGDDFVQTNMEAEVTWKGEVSPMQPEGPSSTSISQYTYTLRDRIGQA